MPSGRHVDYCALTGSGPTGAAHGRTERDKIPRRYTGLTASEQARRRLWPTRAERPGRSALCPPVGIPCRQLIRTLFRIPLTPEQLDLGEYARLALAGMIEAGRAADAVLLARRAVERVTGGLLHIDDSSGVIGADLRELTGLYARACVIAPPDAAKLAEWLPLPGATGRDGRTSRSRTSHRPSVQRDWPSSPGWSRNAGPQESLAPGAPAGVSAACARNWPPCPATWARMSRRWRRRRGPGATSVRSSRYCGTPDATVRRKSGRARGSRRAVLLDRPAARATRRAASRQRPRGRGRRHVPGRVRAAGDALRLRSAAEGRRAGRAVAGPAGLGAGFHARAGAHGRVPAGPSERSNFRAAPRKPSGARLVNRGGPP